MIPGLGVALYMSHARHVIMWLCLAAGELAVSECHGA